MSEPSCSERRALVAETRAVLDELASGGAVTRDVVVALDGTARRLLNWIEAMNGRILELEGELRESDAVCAKKMAALVKVKLWAVQHDERELLELAHTGPGTFAEDFRASLMEVGQDE